MSCLGSNKFAQIYENVNLNSEFVCVCVCMCVCIYIYIHVYIYIYTRVYIYIYTHTYTHTHTQIQNLSLHFHKFGQICLTPNKTQDVPIIPEISLQQLFSLNFPPQNSHCCDFSHHQFLYALLELHINRIIQYVIFCVCGFFYTTFSF